MTGYTVHTGSSEKFAAGWDRIFGKKTGQKKDKPAAKPKATASKKKK
jgi:hypothetical protein